MEVIYTKNAPNPVGPYSQAIVSNNLIFCSGQIAINPKTNELVVDTIENETLQVMKNIEALLSASGVGFDNVIKTTCFLANMDDFQKFNSVYAKYFTSNPARSCVQAKLPKGARVEVEVIAIR